MRIVYTEGLGAEGVEECLNLRPATDGSRELRAVERPAKAAPAGHMPLLHFPADRGMMLLTHKGNELYVTDEGGTTRSAGRAAGEPLCAVCTGKRVIVSTDAGMTVLDGPDYTTGGSGRAEDYPAVALRAADTGMVVTDVGARKLGGGDYRNESTLTAADARSVGADIRGAYAELAETARAQGVMMQPALARYTLLDAEGRELFAGPPVLLGTAQCTRAVRCDIDSEGLMKGYRLSAQTWRLQLTVPPHNCRAVHSVRVSVTPQLHTADATGEAEIWLSHTTTATATASIRLKSGAPLKESAEGAAARMEMLERIVLTTDATAGTTEIECGATAEPAAEAAAVAAALARPLTGAGRNEYLTQAPHSFTARCGAVSGDTVMWGNVAPRRYSGYPAQVLAASVKTGAWRAYVGVEFAGGEERTVWTGEGSGDAPALFGPLLSYPAPDAVRMTIGVSTEEENRAGSFELRPLAGGRAAAYLHDSLAPFELDVAADYTEPESKTAENTLSDTVIAADAGTPFVALAARGGYGHSIVRMLAAGGSTASWDFGRTRMLAFGTGGIYSAALNSARNALAAGRLDSRRTERGDAVTDAADGAVYAIAGGDLVAVGARGTSTIIRDCGLQALAWDSAHGELWGADAEGMVTVICTGSKGLRRYRRDIVLSGGIASGECGAFAATAEGVVALHKTAAGGVRAEWRGRIESAGGERRRAGRITVHAAGSRLDLNVGIAAAGAQAAEKAPTLTVRLSGDVRSAIALRTILRPVRHMVASVEGNVESDFRISKIAIE